MPKQLRIIHYPSAILRRKTKFVKEFGPNLFKLGEQMLKVMKQENGIGLAAPQVGLSKKIIVVSVSDGEETYMLANPKVVWEGPVQESFVEGCLSLPEVEGEVLRPRDIRVKAQALDTGEEFELEADGLLARCLQHEIDHLNGVLFIDHLTPRERHQVEPQLKDLERVLA